MNPSNDKASDRGTDHYFSEEPGSKSHRRTFTIRGRDSDLELEAESGVFSQHGLDKGTAVLLEHMTRHGKPTLASGSTICDLGCGSGAIALTLASHYPDCTVVAVDINERARSLCEENAARNHLKNVRVVAPESEEARTRFDMIWSNPPIRIGKQALHELLGIWLGRLAPGGHARLVVGKNLGADSLANWLEESGFEARKLASSKGFRILEVTIGGQ